ncbi:MAG TPA: Fe-S protein assembly co-chaperone HscB, partial [Polyangiaceae bacterium]|nr:Fe-S protein assembly co-chaperone HscB [Polyangiaceae bacterium]
MANAFETMGLQPSFALDERTLEERQRELNRAVHPDRHAGKSPGERRQALSRAMDINLAYRTLRDPATRAEALLELLGVPALGDRERTISDPALLGEMLERREQLEEARLGKDTATLRELGAHMAERERRVLGALEQAFSALFVATQVATNVAATNGAEAASAAPPAAD